MGFSTDQDKVVRNPVPGTTLHHRAYVARQLSTD